MIGEVSGQQTYVSKDGSSKMPMYMTHGKELILGCVYLDNDPK
jgi:hypothetical protein